MCDELKFAGRLGIIQRVLPNYRVDFIDLLAERCTRGAAIFAGDPLPKENIHTGIIPQSAVYENARNIHFADPSSKFFFCYQRGLRDWLERWQPDALIVESNPRNLSTKTAVRWMHERKRPVLGWGLGAPAHSSPIAALRDRRRDQFLQSMDGVIAYSQDGQREYRRAGVPQDRTWVAYNSVSRRPGKLTPERPPEFDGKPNVLFVGRLQERKRIDILLQSCAMLPEEIQPAVTVIGDGPAREGFMQQAEQYYPSAEFPGALHGDDLIPYFQKADLFVLPGSGGLAVQQAMGYALPVIVAEGDGTQGDMVRPGNGWLVPPGDLDAFRGSLAEALSDATRLRRMGLESFRIVRDEINLESMADTFVQALNTVTGRR